LALVYLASLLLLPVPLVTANTAAAATGEQHQQQQRIVEHPENTTVRVGETVTLRCRVENQAHFFTPKNLTFKLYLKIIQ
jgi:plastocyanin